MNHIISNSKIDWIKVILGAAVIFSGLLAGQTFDRYFVQFPSFKRLEIIYWANYSRYADLGNGLILYPLEAIGSFLLVLICTIMVWKDRMVLKPASLLIFAALFLSLSGLVFTLLAAPVMLSLKTMHNDPELLQIAFHRFEYWGAYRGIAQVLLFFVSVLALLKIKPLETASHS